MIQHNWLKQKSDFFLYQKTNFFVDCDMNMLYTVLNLYFFSIGFSLYHLGHPVFLMPPFYLYSHPLPLLFNLLL